MHGIGNYLALRRICLKRKQYSLCSGQYVCSPPLNTIKQVSVRIRQQFTAKSLRLLAVQDFKIVHFEHWNGIPETFIHNIIASMENRRAVVLNICDPTARLARHHLFLQKWFLAQVVSKSNICIL